MARSDVLQRLASDGVNDPLIKLLVDLVFDEKITSTQSVAIHRAVRLVYNMRGNTDVQNFVGNVFIEELGDLLDELHVL